MRGTYTPGNTRMHHGNRSPSGLTAGPMEGREPDGPSGQAGGRAEEKLGRTDKLEKGGCQISQATSTRTISPDLIRGLLAARNAAAIVLSAHSRDAVMSPPAAPPYLHRLLSGLTGEPMGR